MDAYETKLVLDDRAAHIARGWLASFCRPDPLYPANSVTSIYYDTPQWSYLDEKENSDFLKTKVRLRWYGSLDAFEPQGEVRLEVKSKRGARRSKLRIPMNLPAAAIARLPLEHPTLRRIPDALHQAGVPTPGHLLPAVQIRYRRWRFVDPRSGARLCLDSAISVPRVNRRMVFRHRPSRLDLAVVEIKAPTREAPRLVSRLSWLGCRKESFSKYRNCLHALTSEVD